MYLLEIWQYSPFYDPTEPRVMLQIFRQDVLNANILIKINERDPFYRFRLLSRSNAFIF